MEAKESVEIRDAVINKAIDYIFDHLDGDISVEDVARHCGYSRYHLTRLFKDSTEEAIYQFIKRVRLERSAWRLKVEKEKSVAEIGEDVGYSSSNFATAFKKQLNLSPADFRRNSEKLVMESSFSHGLSLDDIRTGGNHITVEYLKPFCVIYERKKGNYHRIGDEWCAFREKYRCLATEDTLLLECTIDDPSITDENECLYELCQTVDPDRPELKEHPEILTRRCEGGKYAVYHFKGVPSFLFMVYQGIFCRWLSDTGNALDDRPIFDIYRHIGEDGYMEIDICFPIR